MILHHDSGRHYDLNRPIDLSIRLRHGDRNPNAFFAPQPAFTPLRAGDFVGSTAAGAPVNFFDVRYNPHGNGTHTECVGHIARESHHIGDALQSFLHEATVLSISPVDRSGDHLIDADHIPAIHTPALILRTRPRHADPITHWTGTNPPFLTTTAMHRIVAMGVDHLLVDLPSVDKEEDGGALAAHKAFWRYPSEAVRATATITEMVRIPDDVPDGLYLLDLQVMNWALDAAPSRPVLYPVAG